MEIEANSKLIRLLPDDKMLFKLYFILGGYYCHPSIANWDKAMGSYQEAIENAADKNLLINTYYNTGYTYFKKGDIGKKDEAFNNAVILGSELKFLESRLEKDLITALFRNERIPQ